MKGKFFIAGFFLFAAQVQAQFPQLDQHPTGNPFFVNTADGKSMLWGPNYRVVGSPFYNDNYLPADITLVTGEIFTNIRVKFNLFDHTLQYLLPDGTEQAATSDVKCIRFYDQANENAWLSGVKLESSTGQLNKKDGSVYAVLDSGKISLLQDLHMNWSDNQAYGEATITRTFMRKETLMTRGQNADPVKLDKNKADVLTLLFDKKAQVENFIGNNGLSCRSVPDLVRIFQYYNSL